MGLWTLVGVLVGAWALRLGFVAVHFSDLDGMWYDFERRQGRFHVARLLDYATLLAFLGGAAGALWKLDEQDSHRVATFFVAWLGWSLLERLPVHRFPRTNRPGAYQAAQVSLASHLIMALLSALAVSAAAWTYYWWRG